MHHQAASPSRSAGGGGGGGRTEKLFPLSQDFSYSLAEPPGLLIRSDRISFFNFKITGSLISWTTMTTRVFLGVVFSLCIWGGLSSEPDSGGYYSGIDTKLNGKDFQHQLTKLVSNHTVLTYNKLWIAFDTLDAYAQAEHCDEGLIEDIYSKKCWTPKSDQCGNFKHEGDCFNREHSWPKSWWGGDHLHSYTDLFHLFPADGKDNSERSNYALGNVDRSKTIRYESDDQSILGDCIGVSDTYPVPKTCWEPSDRVKGELARAYFYMETCYMDTFVCCDNDAVKGSVIKPWLRLTLADWHNKFPATKQEENRNDLIFSNFQHNRNPFIDHPEWVAKIL